MKLCNSSSEANEEVCYAEDLVPADWKKTFALGSFFIAKLAAGLASQTYWTCGIAYMDDNVKNIAAPAILGVCYMAGYLGGFLGIVLASACLKFKIGEDLLGAWQLGWPIIGSFHSMLAFGFLFLPHRFPTSQGVELKDQEETFQLSFPDNDKIKN